MCVCKYSKIVQKANDPMWAGQHNILVLHYNFTVCNITTLTTWTFKVSLQELTHVLQQYSSSFVHDGTIKQINS